MQVLKLSSRVRIFLQFMATRIRIFTVGFSLCWLAFLAANIPSYRHRDEQLLLPGGGQINDGFVHFGFPFSICVSGGLGGLHRALWTGLFADLALALLVSVCVGSTCVRLFKNVKLSYPF
jgi:hypothetical protein